MRLAPRLSFGRLCLELVLVAVLYTVSGRLGLLLAHVSTHITLLWPPTGIAVAALLLRDRRLWPGIALGAVAVNLLQGSSPALAACIGVGNTLGPMLTVALLERWGVVGALERRRDVGGFAIATILGMGLPCTLGVASLLAFGVTEPSEVLGSWALWWLGDTIGVLVLVPLSFELPRLGTLGPKRGLELASALAVAAAVGALVFYVPAASHLEFLLWAPLMWGALRFPGAGAMSVVFVAGIFAIFSTTSGRGAFATVEPLAGLLMLSTFLGTGALSSSFVGALLAERERAERATREGEARLAAILDAAYDAILAVDAGGRIVRFNRSAERTFGVVATEVEGAPIERFVAIDLASAPEGHSERPAVRADGSSFPAAVALQHVVVDGERLTTLALRDLSAERLAEARERALEEQLRQTDKLRALGTLASGVAHDFNNVLTGILLGLELVKSEVGRDGQATETIDEMMKEGQRASDVVRDLLTFARPQAATRRNVRVNASAIEVRTLLRASFPATVWLDVETDPEDPLVAADPTQLHQVLLNLATNARQALEGDRGHIVIRISTRTVPPPLAAAHGVEPGTFASIEVIDDGRGMDGDTQKRIFEPFFTQRSHEAGSGLGLAMVHGIVSAHAGFVTVESALGEGATFQVWLPLSLEAEESVPTAPTEPSSLAGLTVLVVDDEPAVLDATARILERAGAHVTRTTNAAEALSAAKGRAFDVIWSDFTMPGENGLELAAALRALEDPTPVVLMSGQAALLDRLEVERAGVCSVLAKPFTGAALVLAVKDARAPGLTARAGG